jgi:hypothetical protein
LIRFVKKLKDLHKFDIELEGNIEDIIKSPKEWGERMAEIALLSNLDRYLKAKELGKEFSSEIRD